MLLSFVFFGLSLFSCFSKIRIKWEEDTTYRNNLKIDCLWPNTNIYRRLYLLIHKPNWIKMILCLPSPHNVNLDNKNQQYIHSIYLLGILKFLFLFQTQILYAESSEETKEIVNSWHNWLFIGKKNHLHLAWFQIEERLALHTYCKTWLIFWQCQAKYRCLYLSRIFRISQQSFIWFLNP